MTISFDEFVSSLMDDLTPAELNEAVVYSIESYIPAGTELGFPGINFKVETNSYLAFVDCQPMANWGHSARFILINDRKEARSYPVRLPPSLHGDKYHWKIIYKAPSVPDSIIEGFEG